MAFLEVSMIAKTIVVFVCGSTFRSWFRKFPRIIFSNFLKERPVENNTPKFRRIYQSLTGMW